VALVYFAQYIFDHSTLVAFFPDWLLALVPPLQRMARWLPEDLLTFAEWLTIIGIFGFGLIAPLWNGESNRLFRRTRPDGSAPARRALVPVRWGLLAVALGLAGYCALRAGAGEDSARLWAVWAAAIAAYLAACAAAGWGEPGVTMAERYTQVVRPWSSWPYLLALLAALALLYAYALPQLPVRVDGVTAAAGLQAEAWLQGVPAGAEKTGPTSTPARWPVRLTTWLAQDGLLGARAAGVLAALATVAGVWLVATELFRRTPRYGEYGEVLEDDGRWLAFLAALVAGSGMGMYHFARAPLFLDGVALGAWSLWALMRGLRTDRPWLLGVSAVLVGWSWFYGAVGLSVTLTALAWWAGVWLLARPWLTGMMVAPATGAPVQVQRGAGWRGAAYWVAGVAISATPWLGAWATQPAALLRQLTWPGAAGTVERATLGGMADALRLAVLGLNHYPDQSGLAPYAEHLLPSLLAPLVALALGALLLNMDSLVGWGVLSWLVAGLAGAALTAPSQPSWPALLPVLPAVSLAVAFVLDRLRVLLMETLGTWSLQATVYLAVGVVAAAALLSWVRFYQVGNLEVDLASAVGRAAREQGSAEHLVLVNGQASLGALAEEPVVRLLAGASHANEMLVVQAGEWPNDLPTPARLLVAPADRGLIPILQVRYPGGAWRVGRNLHANPLLYVYDLPAADE
jgi:hypothetical protein